MRHEVSHFSQSFSKEASLLLSCISQSMGLIPAEALNGRVTTEIDWAKFLDLVGEHRAVGSVLSGLISLGTHNVPESVLADLKADHGNNVRRSFFLTSKLIDTLRLLKSRSIPAISFKGPVLSLEAYGNPALRGSGDLDLLIQRPHMRAARKLLIDHGFAPIFPTSTAAEARYLLSLTGKRLAQYVNSHSEHHLMHPQGRLNIDLHWDITLRQFATPLDSRKLWESARTVKLGQLSIPTLGTEDLLLVLCINASKDCWLRLDRVCDVAGLIFRNPEIDFKSLLRTARKAGAGRMVLVTLLLAQEMLGLPLAEIVSEEIATDQACEPLAAECAARIFADDPSSGDEPSRVNETLMQLRARDQLHSQIRYLLCQCHPTVGDWSTVPLPHTLEFLHFLIRPFRLLLQRAS